MTTYYPINENLARASHDMRSMSTYPDGYASREYLSLMRISEPTRPY